ncbi:MAG: hypothetical protein GY711_04840 [bacterium]|nr:hypothetical protein [bacterium]
MRSVAFDALGERLVTGDEAGRLTVWDTANWERTMALKGDAKMLRSTAFSGDGELLGAGALDGSGIVWDLRGVEEMLG